MNLIDILVLLVYCIVFKLYLC